MKTEEVKTDQKVKKEPKTEREPVKTKISRFDAKEICDSLKESHNTGVSWEGQFRIAKVLTILKRLSKEYEEMKEAIMDGNKPDGLDDLVAKLRVIEQKPKKSWSETENAFYADNYYCWQAKVAEQKYRSRIPLKKLDEELVEIEIVKISKEDSKAFSENNTLTFETVQLFRDNITE
jgi:hypothetical protein